MNIYLDTAKTQEWGSILGCAPICGVTTNPTLILQAGLRVRLADYHGLITSAHTQNIAHLMLQLPTPDVAVCLDWAHHLSAQAAASNAPLNLTFKLPCHPAWQAAHSALRLAGHSTLLTGVSNSVQLLWAKAQDASYVAPYLSRLEQAGRDVDSFIAALVAVQSQGGPMVMAASVKTETLFTKLIAHGINACTVKPEFLINLALDPLTQSAIAQFTHDCSVQD